MKVNILIIVYLFFYVQSFQVKANEKIEAQINTDIDMNLNSVIGFKCYKVKSKECFGWILSELSRNYRIPIIVESNEFENGNVKVRLKQKYGLLKDLLKDALGQLPSKHEFFVRNRVLIIREKGFGGEKKYPFKYYKLFEKEVPKKWEEVILSKDEKLFPKNFVNGVPDKWREKWKEILNKKRDWSSLYEGDSKLVPLYKGIISSKNTCDLMYLSLRTLRIVTGFGMAELTKEQQKELWKELKPNMSIEKLIARTVNKYNGCCYIRKYNGYYNIFKKDSPEIYKHIRDKDEPFYAMSFIFYQDPNSDLQKHWIESLIFSHTETPLSTLLTDKGGGKLNLTVENSENSYLSFHNSCGSGEILALYAEIDGKGHSYIIFPFSNFQMRSFKLAPGKKMKIPIQLNEKTPVIKLQDKIDFKEEKWDPDKWEYTTFGKIPEPQLHIKPVITFYSADYKKPFKAIGKPIQFRKESFPKKGTSETENP